MKLLKEILREEERGYIRRSQIGNLATFKYTQKCVIDGHWTPVTRLARGLVFNMSTEKRLNHPLPKFFNLGEHSESEINKLLKSVVGIYEKLDGSCGTGYYYDGWKLTTPGGIASEQALRGQSMFSRYSFGTFNEERQLGNYVTPIWEIIYPDLENVVDYGDKEELILLTVFNYDGTEWDDWRVDQAAKECGFNRPKVYPDIDLTNPTFISNSEGYVLKCSDGTRVKIKNPDYVLAHKLLTGNPIKTTIDLLESGNTDVFRQLSKEYKNRVDDLIGIVRACYHNIISDVQHYTDFNNKKIVHQNSPKNMRKRQALWIQENVPKELMHLVFMSIDGKDFSSNVWKLVRQKLL